MRFFSLIILVVITSICGQDNAEVNIRVSGACSPIYLSRKGVEIARFKPSIRFNPDKIILDPKNPAIPGCMKIKALGVEIVKPVKNLVAEIEMRIGGMPDPEQPVLPCSKKIDAKVNQCPCAKVEGSCVFCDFCRQISTHSSSSVVFRENSAANRKINDETCKCEVMLPGFYDIETEMCTPELNDIKEYIPPEIHSDIVEKRPISMFITVYLMDLEQRPNESYLSAFGQALLRRRMAQSTVACFLMGIDVKLNTASGTNQSES
ncbi:unnamed protein product [Dracunculus medinensis]|uniref:Uncharacterized protein n=1 Tax=Dracunculus medinensis TaxID=318479 RepID=A0A3P7PQQ6_DRAME|nr:unnamed protein product [Dracunculus medinensis]